MLPSATKRRFTPVSPLAVSVYYSPIGLIGLAADSQGLLSVELGIASLEAYLAHLRAWFTPQTTLVEKTLVDIKRELDGYFRGSKHMFQTKINPILTSDFTRRVLTETARIPWGRVLTYGELAKKIGRPRAARAVGRALGANPIPLFIPCHRVIGAGGSLTGFSGGGVKVKRWLLAHEGVNLPPGN